MSSDFEVFQEHLVADYRLTSFFLLFFLSTWAYIADRGHSLVSAVFVSSSFFINKVVVSCTQPLLLSHHVAASD